jgi:hypothetical protein
MPRWYVNLYTFLDTGKEKKGGFRSEMIAYMFCE